MNYNTWSLIVIAAFFIGFAFGFAACFYGVRVRNAEPVVVEPQFVGKLPGGPCISDTISPNPAKSWSLLLAMVRRHEPKATLKSIRAQGYKVERV